MGDVADREAADQRNAQLLRQAFTGKMRRPQPGAGLIFALAVTAVVMVLLPILYVLLVVAIGGAVVWLAVQCAHPFDGEGPLAGHFKLKFALLVAAITAFFFMLKPLIAPRLKVPSPGELRPSDEPRLYAFLCEVCDSMGAPRPARTEIELECGASASLHRGFMSFFTDDLTLRVGIALAGNLSLQEFAGVLAHEFGHFTQRTSMRLYYIIVRVNLWFARVVYERDAWDARLEESAENTDRITESITQVARFAVFASRSILWCLMHAGVAASSHTSRQMEYHADACAAQLVGSDSFERLMHRLSLLSSARNEAAEFMIAQLREANNPDAEETPNYVEVLGALAGEIAKKTGGRSTVTPRKTGLFDTHPSDLDRIERVRALNAPGVFHLNGPASTLFRDFDRLAKRMSKERALQIMPYLKRG